MTDLSKLTANTSAKCRLKLDERRNNRNIKTPLNALGNLLKWPISNSDIDQDLNIRKSIV